MSLTVDRLLDRKPRLMISDVSVTVVLLLKHDYQCVNDAIGYVIACMTTNDVCNRNTVAYKYFFILIVNPKNKIARADKRRCQIVNTTMSNIYSTLHHAVARWFAVESFVGCRPIMCSEIVARPIRPLE